MKFVLDCFSVGFVGNKRRRMNDDFQFFFSFWILFNWSISL